MIFVPAVRVWKKMSRSSQGRRLLLARQLSVSLLAVIALFAQGDVCKSAERSAGPIDEAQAAGRNELSLPQASEDFFHDMDNGVVLGPD